MEGVVVSAKKAGAPSRSRVVTDDKGQYSFPAARLEPGPIHAQRSARSATTSTARRPPTWRPASAATADIKLKPTRNLSGAAHQCRMDDEHAGHRRPEEGDPAQLQQLPHLERIVQLDAHADEFLQIFQRMGGYYPGSTPLKPQRLIGDALPRGRPRRRRCQEDTPNGSPSST